LRIALRLVGLLLLALAAGIGYAYLSLAQVNDYVVSQQLASGHWWAPVSPTAMQTRGYVQTGAGIVTALLTAAAGAGFLRRRHWGLWLALIAVAVPPLFAPVTRLLLPKQLQFDGPSPIDWLLASSIGLIAAVGFMFVKDSSGAPDSVRAAGGRTPAATSLHAIDRHARS
jgi:hypothetical protein